MEERIVRNSDTSDEISLKDLILKIQDWFKYLRSKWLIIFCFGIVGGVIGFAYAYIKKPIYIATTTFVLEDGEKSGGLSSLGGLASMVGLDMGGGGGIFQGDNILELYKSRRMITKTLLTEVNYNGRKQLLLNRYIAFNNLKEKWSKKPILANIRFSSSRSVDSLDRLQDSVLNVIVGDINKNYLSVIKPDRKSSIIRAQVKSTDELFAKLFNDQIVKNVNDFYIQTKTKKSMQNVEILQQKVDSVRNVMNGAIYSAAAVADATPNLNPTRQIQRLAPVQRSQFNAEANKLILGEISKNLEISKISLRKETPLIQVIDSPVFPLTIDKFGKLKTMLVCGIFSGMLVVFFFLFRRIYKDIIS